MKDRTDRYGHSLTEVREEALVMVAEMFKLAFMRYGNTVSIKVLFQYFENLQPDELGGILREAEERAIEDITQAEKGTVH